jgi:hypothetical protein
MSLGGQLQRRGVMEPARLNSGQHPLRQRLHLLAEPLPLPAFRLFRLTLPGRPLRAAHLGRESHDLKS